MVDEHDTSEDAVHTHATDELASMRQRHDELCGGSTSVARDRAAVRSLARALPWIPHTSREALSLEVEPEAESTGNSLVEKE